MWLVKKKKKEYLDASLEFEEAKMFEVKKDSQ